MEAHYSTDKDDTAKYKMVYAISGAFVSTIHDLADAIRSTRH